jgi:hypothetical protein
MKKSFFLFCLFIVFISLFSSCTDATETRRILAAQGFKKIEITGYNFWGCGKEDFYHTGFNAISPNNTPISGTVCSGLFFKGSTVRF